MSRMVLTRRQHVQVERAVEHISDKVDELALRPEVFGTRLDEHVMQLMAEQKRLTSAIEGLTSTVALLKPDSAAPSAAAAASSQEFSGASWPAGTAYVPAMWAAAGALVGALAAAAYVRAQHR